MFNPIRDGKKTTLALSFATISLFMLSAPLTFADSNGNNSPVIPTDVKAAAGAASGFASYLSFGFGGLNNQHASDIQASHQAFVNKMKTDVQKPYALELEQLQTHEALSAEGKIRELEKEYKTKAEQLDVAKNGKTYIKTEQRVVYAKYPFSGGKPVKEVIDVIHTPVVILPQGSHEIPAHLNVPAGTATQYSQRMSAGGGAPWGIQYHGTSPVQPQITRANPINIKRYERRLTQIKSELRALKAKYPAASIDRARSRVASAGNVGTREFKPDSKLFSKNEAAELSLEHENIQNFLHDSNQVVRSMTGRAQAFRALGTMAAGASVITLGSAISDLMDKKATSVLSDGYAPAEQASGGPSSRSLK